MIDIQKQIVHWRNGADQYQIEGRYPDMLPPAPDLETTQQELKIAGEMLQWLNTQFYEPFKII